MLHSEMNHVLARRINAMNALIAILDAEYSEKYPMIDTYLNFAARGHP
jgi:hypothetical protein